MDIKELKYILSKVKNFEREIEFSKKSKTNQFDNIHSPKINDIVVITATQDEYDSFARLLHDLHRIEIANDSTIYYKGYIQSYKLRYSVVVPVPSDMGIASAAVITTKCISNFRPKYLFMVGIAAGIKAITKIGDVLIGEKSLDYNEIIEVESNNNKRIKFSNTIIAASNHLKSKLRLFIKEFAIKKSTDNPLITSLEREISFHFGIIVTGSALIRSVDRVNQLIRDYHNIKGIDMETYGVYKSASSYEKSLLPQFLSIKSVSDYGMNEKDNDLSNPQHKKDIALLTSSFTLFEFIKSDFFE